MTRTYEAAIEFGKQPAQPPSADNAAPSTHQTPADPFAEHDAVLQLLDATGHRCDREVQQRPDTPELHRTIAQLADELTADDLRTFLRDMTLVRRFDTEATALQRQGELGLWAPALGQEGSQIGSGRAMAPQDHVFPSYREHPVGWTRGLDLIDILRMFRGQQHGGWDPTAAHNFHLYTLVIGSHTLHATGFAMGMQRDGVVGTGDPTKDAATTVYFGDGASSQGDVAEAFGFASVNQAPVVFFCQNNQWAISVPTSSQTRVPIARRALGYGIPAVRIDGNDVIAGWAATRWALDHARSGRGPVLIEAMTYRMGAHTTSDDPTRYRSAEEEAQWRAKDPIDRLRAHLDREGLLSNEFLSDLEAESDAYADRIRTAVRAMGPPPPHSIFEHVYAEDHQQVAAERAWFEQYAASFVDEPGGAQ